MDTFLPQGFAPDRTRNRMSRPARTPQLCVEKGGVYYPVLRRWDTGFAVSAQDVPTLHGIVNLYDGAEHLHRCLITARETDQDEQIFTIQRSKPAAEMSPKSESQPPAPHI